MSRNFSLDSVSQTIFSGFRNSNLQYENRIIISANTTFVVPPNTKAIKFSAVGGGRAGVGTTGGPGGGYFEKTFYAPFTGLTTSFQLTVGAVGGNTILANSAGTTIATAFGATAIGAGFPVGVGGTASGGDLNANGSPGGTSPGVGGASGGCFGDAQYNSTFAGRWVYLAESFTNDNVKNFMLTNYYINAGNPGFFANLPTVSPPATNYVGFAAVVNGPSFVFGSPGGLFGAAGAGGAGGFGAPGGPLNPLSFVPGAGPGGLGGSGGVAGGPTGGIGGPGGFGAPGGPASADGGGGPGGFGGSGGSGGSPSPFFPNGGGPGGFGGGGGFGRSPGGLPGNGFPGGPGGFGGGGGAGSIAGPPPAFLGPGTAGSGGPGAFIIEWTTTLPNKTGV